MNDSSGYGNHGTMAGISKARLYSLLPFAIGKCHTSSLIASRKLRRVAREGNRDGKAWRKPNQ